jgi:hypothetical protein
MNIALGALLLFLLFIPGLLFRIAFLKSDSLKSNIDTTILNELLFVSVPALVFHLCGILLVESFRGLEVRLDQFYYLITGAKGSAQIDFEVIKNSLPGFTLYLLGASAIGASLGIALQCFVIRFDLDSRFPFLRLSNEWERLLSGRVLGPAYRKQIEFIQVDVLTSGDEGSMLYCGILEKYTLNSKIGLENIYMSSVYRRRLSSDYRRANPVVRDTMLTEEEVDLKFDDTSVISKDKDDRYYNMPGDYFMIPISEVKNINITYYQAMEEE